MLRQYHQTVGPVYRLLDACVIIGCWLLAYWARFSLPLVEVTKGFPAFGTYASLTPLIVLVWQIVFSSQDIYVPKQMPRRTQEAHAVLRAHFSALVVFLALTYLFSEYRYSRVVMFFFGIMSAFLLVLSRMALRNSLRALKRRGHRVKQVLLIGEGLPLEVLVGRLRKFPELGLHPLGAVIQDQGSAKEIAGTAVIGKFSEIPALMRSRKVDQILIALPREQAAETNRILAMLKEETVDIHILPDLHEFITLGCAVEDFDGLPIVNLNESPLEGWGAIAKRTTDVVLSAIALIVLSPLLFLLGILVRLSSPGPILFRQERMGLDGRTFQMLKFRSMRTDAEAATGAVWAKPGDDRKTAVGSFIRATSLDELPQLWNVLRGEMSLVGPRPERPVFVGQFRTQIPNYMLRHKVKAGITGWAQVQGWRGNTSLEKRIECDLYYIRHWSYALDLKILLFTVWKGFVHKNAY